MSQLFSFEFVLLQKILEKDERNHAYVLVADGSANASLEDPLEVIEQAAATVLRKHFSLDSSTEISLVTYEPMEPLGVTNVFRMSDLEREEKMKHVNDEYLHGKAYRFGSSNPLKKLEIKGTLMIVFTLETSRRSLYTVDEHDESRPSVSRESIAIAGRKRDSPSAGAKLVSLISTQVLDRPDAVYNYRPLELHPPPITIYHPVFTKFIQQMAIPHETLEFSHTELDNAFEFITKSLAFYVDEIYRQSNLGILEKALEANGIITTTVLRISGRKVEPGGNQMVPCPVISPRKALKDVTEIKNEIGEGGSDPIAQAECVLVAAYSSEEYRPLREASCCPAFLIGIAGPNLTVSGAVFADNIISQRLADYVFLGPHLTTSTRSSLDEGIRRVAHLFRVLRECLNDLEGYYAQLKPLLGRSGRSPANRGRTSLNPGPAQRPPRSLPTFVSPHFVRCTVNDRKVQLTYLARLVSHHRDKAVFKAKAIFEAQGNNPSETKIVVVKFTHSYCSDGHRLLASASPPLAPNLWYCEKVDSVGLYVVIMDFVPGEQMRESLSVDCILPLRKAMKTLHENDLVFGDLRAPNVLVTVKGIMLVDFDWCGKVGEARYPSDIFMDNGESMDWHKDVQ